MRANTNDKQAVSVQYDSGQLADKDEFHRRPFAASIADIIINRPPGEPLVVAMVGEWGSGKSTTLHYVKECLSVKQCGVAEFNPWRFAGEEALLLELFSKLVKAIGMEYDVFTPWQKFKSWFGANQEPLSDVMIAAGNAKFPGVGSIAGGAMGFLSGKLRTRIEQVREQAREHLARSSKRIVVLLDDIDRLEVNDMLTLMRLIKLTGDLPNVTYVLAMDEDHVSRVIGQRLDGNLETGRSYLEKIINVRLSLPHIPDYRMKSYTLDLIEQVLKNTGCHLSIEDAKRTGEHFDALFAPLITTPRKAKSIANAYRFSIGLLPLGEINAGDLMIVECIRLLKPSVYQALIKNANHLLDGPRDDGLDSIDTQAEAATKVNEFLEAILRNSDLSGADAVLARRAMRVLFPQCNSEIGFEGPDEWVKAKRICSRSYFWRYFSGAIQNDDVSDHVIDEWLATLSKDDSTKIREVFLGHLKAEYSEAFMGKLVVAAKHLPMEVKKLLALLLAAAAKDFSKASAKTLGISYWQRASMLAAECVTSLESEVEIKRVGCEVIAASKDLMWCFAFLNRLPKYCRTQRAKVTDGSARQELGPVEVVLAERVLREFEAHPPTNPHETMEMVWILWRNRDKISTQTEVTKLVKKHQHLAIHFLAAGCNFSETVSNPNRTWKWNGKQSVQEIGKIIDLGVLTRILKERLNVHPEIVPAGESDDTWDNERESLDMIARRFLAEREHV